MAKEIERRFLLGDFESGEDLRSYLNKIKNKVGIKQKYLHRNDSDLNIHGHDVRIRLQSKKTYITTKFYGSKDGIDEFEYEIPYSDGLEIYKKIKHEPVLKTRYIITNKDNGLKYEIDYFKGKNEGLVVVEVEFPSMKEANNFDKIKPNWFGEEVTYDKKFSNRNLYVYPYQVWIEKKVRN